MVVLRPTQKLRAVLPMSAFVGESDTALGDWYVNRLVVDRQPLLLLVSSKSLLPVLVRARDVKALPDHVAGIVADRLVRLGISTSIIDAERQAMSSVKTAATNDRSVLGIMVDFAKAIPYYLEAGGWNDPALEMVEDRLAETPCYAGKPGDQVVYPKERAPELLAARWGLGGPISLPGTGPRTLSGLE